MLKIDALKLSLTKRQIFIHFLVFFIITILIFLKFPCPVKYFFNIPCPACGTLHALRALLKLDLKSYFRFNFLALPMVFAVWAGIHKKSLLHNSKIVDVIIYFVCGLAIIRYFFILLLDNFVNII